MEQSEACAKVEESYSTQGIETAATQAAIRMQMVSFNIGD
jgi:hypothetical protein